MISDGIQYVAGQFSGQSELVKQCRVPKMTAKMHWPNFSFGRIFFMSQVTPELAGNQNSSTMSRVTPPAELFKLLQYLSMQDLCKTYSAEIIPEEYFCTRSMYLATNYLVQLYRFVSLPSHCVSLLSDWSKVKKLLTFRRPRSPERLWLILWLPRSGLRPPTMAIRPYLPTWTSASALQAVISAAAADPTLSQLDRYRMELEFSLAFRRSLFVNLCSLQGWLPATPLQHANGPLADFFISHDGFVYIPVEPAETQFRRLCSEREWNKHREKKARELYRNALVKQFNVSYGTDETSLDNWRRLCAYLGFFPLSNTIEDYRLVS